MEIKSAELMRSQQLEVLKKTEKETNPSSASENENEGMGVVEGKSDPELYTREEIFREFKMSKEFQGSSYNQAMLEPALKILCGETNKNVHEEEFIFCKKYLETLIQEENVEELENRNRELEKFVDQEMTERLEKAVSFGPDSILSAQYEKLGITTLEQEKKFVIRVLKDPSGEEKGYEEQRKFWIELTGAPTQFAIRTKEGVTIYLSEEDARRLLDKKSTDHKEVLKMFQHEYRHTQRNFASHNDRLFRLLDEVYTNVTGYSDLIAFMKMMTWTTLDMKSKNFMDAYEQDDEQAKISLLQKWEDNFQSEGLLLLGAQKSSEHGDEEDGITSLPLLVIEGAENNDRQRFMETMLSLREGVDRGWLTTFKEKITSPEISLMQLEATRGMGMGKYLKNLKGTRAMRVQSLVDALDAEMLSRKIAGEESLYQKK